MQKNQFSNVKSSLLELEKDVIELKVKIKREMVELFLQQLLGLQVIWMDKFEQKEMKKLRPIKNTRDDWLIDYIPSPIRKSVGGFKDKIASLFETNTPKQPVYGSGKKLRKLKTQPEKKEKKKKKKKIKIKQTK